MKRTLLTLVLAFLVLFGTATTAGAGDLDPPAADAVSLDVLTADPGVLPAEADHRRPSLGTVSNADQTLDLDLNLDLLAIHETRADREQHPAARLAKATFDYESAVHLHRQDLSDLTGFWQLE